jgi:hypothetical protein
MNLGNISILLGSGFSIPEGIPGMAAINKKLAGIKESDFYLSSDQTAGFYHSDYRDPNNKMTFLDRFFLEEFTNFYCEQYLAGDIHSFNYEKFYDFISDFLRFKKEEQQIDAFCHEYNKAITSEPFRLKSYEWLSRTKRILNGLIANMLFLPRHFASVGYLNYPINGAFFGLLREWLKENIVHVHTLNHDIFFDSVANRLTDLWQHYSDGYTEVGSTVYGEVFTNFKDERGDISKTYNVRLQKYTGVYENRLRLYKLHGSIDSYVLKRQTANDEIRIKTDYGVRDFNNEIYDEKAKKFKYDFVFTEKHPDFLTGTTEKIRQYNIPFYEHLFNFFKKNLHTTSLLLVIGYGFQDKGINDFIESHYLIYNKPVVVIDVQKPQCELFEKYPEQFTLLLKSINDFYLDELMEKVFPLPKK